MSDSTTDNQVHAGWRYPLYVGLVCFYASLVLLLNFICLVSSCLPRNEKRTQAIQELAVVFARILRAAIELTGVGKIEFIGFDKLPGEPCILVANHTGLLDALMLLTEVPRAAIVFKRGLRRSPFYSHLTSEGGHIGNDEGLTLLREGSRMLKSRPIMIFPEGTRTERVPVTQFYGGFAAVARRANVPVQAVFIENPSWILGKGRGFFSRYTLPFLYRFELGQVFVPEESENSHELTDRVEAYFQKSLSHLKEPPWRAH